MAQALPAAVIGAANLSEVVGKLSDHGLSVEEVEEVLGSLHLRVRPLTPAQGYAAGYLRPATRIFGLTLGDPACLALAAELDAPALTADKAWASAETGVKIEVIRR